MQKLKICFDAAEARVLKDKGYHDVSLGPSQTAKGYYHVVRGRYDHDSTYPSLSISVPAAYLDALCEKVGVTVPASRYNKSYPGEMGFRGQYYPASEGAAYRFFKPA